MTDKILSPIHFTWTESADASGFTRWRTFLPNGHKAEIYRAVGDGAWCAIVDLRGTRDLGSKEAAIRFAEERLAEMIALEVVTARRNLAALLPMLAAEAWGAASDDPAYLRVEILTLRERIDMLEKDRDDAAEAASHWRDERKLRERAGEHVDHVEDLLRRAEAAEARARTAEAERDDLRELLDKANENVGAHYARVETAEAAVETLKEDRDEWRGRAADRCAEAEKWFRQMGAERERAEIAEAEVARLAALSEGRFRDVRLVEFKDGELVLKGTLFEYIAEFMAQMLISSRDRSDPANYTETRLEHPELGPLVLTLQRGLGKTPHALRREAEAERDALVAALHDAIVRPMGVVPASAERWYRPDQADASAERRLVGERITADEWVRRRMAAVGASRIEAERDLAGALSRIRPDRDLLLPADSVLDAPEATHRHRKGGLYRLVARGRIEAGLEPCAIYESLKDRTVWVRSEAEFSDGRFAPLVDEAALPRLAPLAPRKEDNA
jgi:hypothetical protein